MIIKFEKDYLNELYHKGKCSNKRYRFQPQVVSKYQKRIITPFALTTTIDYYSRWRVRKGGTDNERYQ